MSIFDIFRNSPTAQTAPQQNPAPAHNQQQVQPGQNPGGPETHNLAGTNQHQQGNPTIPNNSNSPTRNPQPNDDPNNTQSPLENFKDIFKIDPNATTQEAQSPFHLDQEKFGQTLAKTSFTQGISQEDLAKISAGGDEAVKALVNVINKVGQNSFGAAVKFASNVGDTAVSHARTSLTNDMPGLIRKHSASDSLFQAHPALRDPAAQPLVEAMQSQFTRQFPNATGPEINDMVVKYFETVPQLFTKPQSQQTKPQGSEQANFGSFL